MNPAIAADVLTMILCSAVLIQSVRMMRSLRTVKDGALTQVVDALEKATVQARIVLSDMKKTLATDCAQHARLVEQARSLCDELTVMSGIADSACERIVSAVGMANAQKSGEADAADPDRDAEDAPAPMQAAA